MSAPTPPTSSGPRAGFDAVGGAYDEQLAQGLRVSGESKEFFRDGRLAMLQRHLPGGVAIRRILDFGCGPGDTSAALCDRFPEATVVGVDASQEMLDLSRSRHRRPRLELKPLGELRHEPRFDLCYVNGVFHHIPPADRSEVAQRLNHSLHPGGILALFENNPLNPGTRWVMRRIPFDRDAVTLYPWQTRRLLQSAGFRTCWPTRYLFFFPRWLSLLRGMEPALTRAPLGAQYLVMAPAAEPR